MFPNVGALVAGYRADFEFVMGLVGRLDVFFPITEASTLFGIFIGFMGVFLLVKAVLKIFPWAVG